MAGTSEQTGLSDYSVTAFLKEVRELVELSHWTNEVAFASIAKDWALCCNHWIEPRLDQAEFYRIVSDAAASLLSVQ